MHVVFHFLFFPLFIAYAHTTACYFSADNALFLDQVGSSRVRSLHGIVLPFMY